MAITTPLVLGLVATGWQYVKTKLGGISLKTWRNIAIAAGLGILLWQAYSWVFARGVAAENARLSPLVEEAQASKQAFVDTFWRWWQTSKVAQDRLKNDNARIVEELEADLASAEERATTTKGLTREIPVYITRESDSHCVVPVGFARLFNTSIEGPAAAADQDRFSGSIAVTHEADSGLTLSQVADAVIANHAEAVRRGEVIEAWQRWYDRNKAAFEKAQLESAADIPTLEELAGPSPQ